MSSSSSSPSPFYPNNDSTLSSFDWPWNAPPLSQRMNSASPLPSSSSSSSLLSTSNLTPRDFVMSRCAEYAKQIHFDFPSMSQENHGNNSHHNGMNIPPSAMVTTASASPSLMNDDHFSPSQSSSSSLIRDDDSSSVVEISQGFHQGSNTFMMTNGNHHSIPLLGTMTPNIGYSSMSMEMTHSSTEIKENHRRVNTSHGSSSPSSSTSEDHYHDNDHEDHDGSDNMDNNSNSNKLSKKERNKISATAYRKRRKEFLDGLEVELQISRDNATREKQQRMRVEQELKVAKLHVEFLQQFVAQRLQEKGIQMVNAAATAHANGNSGNMANTAAVLTQQIQQLQQHQHQESQRQGGERSPMVKNEDTQGNGNGNNGLNIMYSLQQQQQHHMDTSNGVTSTTSSTSSLPIPLPLPLSPNGTVHAVAATSAFLASAMHVASNTSTNVEYSNMMNTSYSTQSGKSLPLVY